jgi:hypothetical protein
MKRSSVSNSKFEVDKFDGTNNFGMWQCEVLDILNQQDLEFTLEERPSDIPDSDWEKLNRQACGTIRLCLSKDIKYEVMKDNSARELWQKLENKYMTKSVENRLYLKKRLYRFQYQQGSSMNEHLNSFNKILADLQNLDVKIEDEDKALLLINSLPDTYDHLTTTLLYGKDEIRFNDVCSALINNEVRKKDQQVHRDPPASALTVGEGPNQRIRILHGDGPSQKGDQLIKVTNQAIGSRLPKMSVHIVTRQGIGRRIAPRSRRIHSSEPTLPEQRMTRRWPCLAHQMPFQTTGSLIQDVPTICVPIGTGSPNSRRSTVA